MTTGQQFLLPDVGEGLTEAEIVGWHVAVGDVVVVNQPLVDIETAKSIVELPSPYAGEVLELLVEAGATVDVGTPIIRIGSPDAPAPPVAAPAAGTASEDAAPEPKLLVGYGAREEMSRRRRGAGSTGSSAQPAPASAAEGDAAPVPAAPVTEGPRAKPPVRKLARVMGVDLLTVIPTGPSGTITRADVLGAAEGAAAAVRPAAEPAPLPGTGAAGDGASRIPVTGVRKQMATAMVASAFTAPHVTEFVTVDVTPTLQLRDEVQRRREFREVKLTPLAFVARAYLLALRRTPLATARWDAAAQEIVVPATINLGIAAATPRGLVVPNIKSAERLGLHELATAINELAATARAGRSTPASMAQGTSTITNVGVFGIDTGTPILNPGESAILAVGTIRRMPWVVGSGDDERIEPRSVLQLALSFDHRVMDGQQGSQLLSDTAEVLARPGLALL